MINDFANEINLNAKEFYEVLNKLNVLSTELPKIEQLYYKM